MGRLTYSRDHHNSYSAREDNRMGNKSYHYRDGHNSWRDKERNGGQHSRYHPYKRKENQEISSRQQIYREVRRLDPPEHRSIRETEGRMSSYQGPDKTHRRDEIRREESSSSKELLDPTVRGTPLRQEPPQIETNVLAEALGEVRDTLMKYTRVEDPTERAARLERMRQAEESGQLERSATRIAEKAMAKQKEVLTEKLDEAMPTARIPVSHRLEAPSEAIVQETTPRISVSLRLGDPGNGISTQERELEKSPSTTPRTSAILRLGPLQTEHRPSLEEGPGTKKKRGRPPGSKKGNKIQATCKPSLMYRLQRALAIDK
ncbi:hypothetical protein Bca101_054867 [Brassica carinata]